MKKLYAVPNLLRNAALLIAADHPQEAQRLANSHKRELHWFPEMVPDFFIDGPSRVVGEGHGDICAGFVA